MQIIGIFLGAVFSLVFISLSIMPEIIDGYAPPIFIRAALLLAGLFLLAATTAAVRHQLWAKKVLTSGLPANVTAHIEIDDWSDSTSYTVIVDARGKRWAVPALYGRGVALILNKKARTIKAWLDPLTGAPAIIDVDGHRIKTYPKVTKL